MKFSNSKVRRYLGCERAGDYEYRHGLVRIKQRKTFNVGTFGHALLEHALLGHAHTGKPAPLDDATAKRVYQDIRKKENIQLEESEFIATLASIRETVDWLDLDNWTTVMLPDGRPAVELAGSVPWRGHELVFRIDWIAKSLKTGKVWIIDHKTTQYSIDETAPSCEFDLQHALYGEAARALGLDVEGMLINLIRVPKTVEPMILKNGALSRAKSKNSMRWSLYERAVLEAGFDPDDYTDMREHLQTKRWNMWRKNVTSPRGLASTLDNCERVLERIEILNHSSPLINFNVALASRLPECDRCPYNAACSYEMDGKSIAPLVGVVYKPKNEQSPWFDNETFESGLEDYFARAQRTDRFDVDTFEP